MKIRIKFLCIVFVAVSCLLAVSVVCLSYANDAVSDKEKREELSYLSSMMKLLAKAIDDGNGDYAKLSAAMIEKSGAVSTLDKENRENTTEFLHDIISGSILAEPKTAAYARKCSAAAIKTAKNEYYDIGSYYSKSELTANWDELEYKSSLSYVNNFSDKNISFYGIKSANKICARRANVYYLSEIGKDEVDEYIYIKSNADKSASFLSSEKTIIETAKKYLSDRGESAFNFEFLFTDMGTSFVRCGTDDASFIIGIECESGEVSHYKKTYNVQL